MIELLTPNWLVEVATEARSVAFLVVVVVTAALAGVVCSGTSLGVVWALRGRPRLARPRCRRCSMVLAPEQVDGTCSECGAPLHRPRATQWVRFRRQPLTLLITLPVLLAASIVVPVAFGQVWWDRIDGAVMEAKGSRAMASAAMQTPTAAPSVIDALHAALAAYEADPSDRAETFDVLMDAILRGWESEPAQAETILGAAARFVALADERDCRIPGLAPRWFPATSRPGNVTRRAAILVLGGLLVERGRLAPEAVAALARRWRSPERLVMPPQLRPGLVLPIEVWAGIDAPPPTLEFTEISCDGQPLWRADDAPFKGCFVRPGAVGIELSLPFEPGEHQIEVRWRSTPATVAGVKPAPAEEHAESRIVRVADEPEWLPPTTAWEEQPIGSAQCMCIRSERRDHLLMQLRSFRAPTLMVGTMSLLRDDGEFPFAHVRAWTSNATIEGFTPPVGVAANAPYPELLRFRFVPSSDTSRDRVQLWLPNRLGSGGSLMGRLFERSWAKETIYVFRRWTPGNYRLDLQATAEANGERDRFGSP